MRYFLKVSYDGTGFHGSQIQGDLMTVQGAINEGLSTLLRQNIETFGASRTDEGVHALGNVYHFDIEGELPAHFIYKLNALTPQTLSVKEVSVPVDQTLNARFDAKSRLYRYRLYQKKDPFRKDRALFFPYPISLEKLEKTAEVLKEYTDFESFCKRNSNTLTHQCTIMQSYWEKQGEEYHFVVEANRFLRGMVRALVATQLKVMRLDNPELALRKIIESKNCTKADFGVSGNGLYLESVNYAEGALTLLSTSRYS